jgi:hypothetical protein
MGIKVSSIGNSITKLGIYDLMYVAEDTGSGFDDAIISGKDLMQFIGGWTPEIRIRTSDILDAYSTPFELMSAPGAGKMILPHKILVRTDYNSTPYATNTNSRFFIPDAGNDLLIGASDLAFTDSRYVYYVIPSGSATLRENRPLMYSVQDGNPTAGDSDIYIRIYYQILEV